MMASKKGMSALQISRMIDLPYKTAWFLCHRIRESLRDTSLPPIGGANKVVEADETYVGGKAKNRAFKEPAPKKSVLSLVERGGHVRSFHVANVTAKTVKPIIAKNVELASMLMTDESTIYPKIGEKFANHGTVNHSASEYVRLGGYLHTNTIENFFSIFKRGIIGSFHHVSEAHLHRYLGEILTASISRFAGANRNFPKGSKSAASAGQARPSSELFTHAPLTRTGTTDSERSMT
jgi:hypothetical protein